MIAPEIIEQVRDAADIVQLIGEHVELKRTGSDWRGPCPFHGGTNRNFSVVPRKQMYHCFVCHESGDIFTFWMKKFGLAYPEAVREIAGKVGVVVPESRQAGPDPNEPLYSALGVAAEWFQRRLREGEDAAHARDYLERRDLASELRDEFGLGFAPPARETLLESMRGLGLADQVLIDAGLAVRREDGSLNPRFRGRLLFPIADVRGRVVGFGGRILGEGEPKYLNSPESAVFHKGTLLYLLDRARGPIRTESLAVVVEGYVDAIRLHAGGITCAVAPLGTALTSEQAKVLRRYTKQVLLANDADAPGQRSAFRAADELLRQGASVSMVTLPDGEDPDTLVRKKGGEAFRALMGEAVDVFDRKLQLLEKKNMFRDTKTRRRALDLLVPTIRAAADPITRELYIGEAARRLAMDKNRLEQEVERGSRRPLTARAAGVDARPAAVPVPEVPEERSVVRLMRADAAWAARAARELRPDEFRHPAYRAIADAIIAGATAPPTDDLAELWEELAEPQLGPFDAEAEFSTAVRWIKDRPRQERLEQIDREMAVAPPEEQGRLYAEKNALIAGGTKRFRRKALKTEREPT